MEPSKATGKRILVVEDDDGARASLKLLLTIDRHSVTEAKNSSEALALFAQERFDLVITDYYMPGGSGNDLAAEIKRLAPSQPILMVSAFLEKLGQPHKAVDVLLGKPFSIADLREAIAKLLA